MVRLVGRVISWSNTHAFGSDELNHRVLKELVTELGPIFVHLFQQKEWPLSKIIPIFKKNDRSLACNRNHVTLTRVLLHSKLLGL